MSFFSYFVDHVQVTVLRPFRRAQMLGAPESPAVPRTQGTQAKEIRAQQRPNAMPSMARSALAHPCASHMDPYQQSNVKGLQRSSLRHQPVPTSPHSLPATSRHDNRQTPLTDCRRYLQETIQLTGHSVPAKQVPQNLRQSWLDHGPSAL